jgi:polar amino acid transport system substrate-binding protein
MNLKSIIFIISLLFTTALLPVGTKSEQNTSIIIGTGFDYRPHYWQTPGGKTHGFDIDIILAICKVTKLNCTIKNINWHDLIPSLLDEKIDLIAAAHSITPERQNLIDFSDIYTDTPMAIAVHRELDTKRVGNEELRGLIIGAHSGTLPQKYLYKYFPDHKKRLFKPNDDYKIELTARRADAVIDDISVLMAWLQTKKGKCCKLYKVLPRDPELNSNGLAFGIRKTDSELKALINKGLNIILSNNTYDKISKKYFNFNVYGNRNRLNVKHKKQN